MQSQYKLNQLARRYHVDYGLDGGAVVWEVDGPNGHIRRVLLGVAFSDVLLGFAGGESFPKTAHDGQRDEPLASALKRCAELGLLLEEGESKVSLARPQPMSAVRGAVTLVKEESVTWAAECCSIAFTRGPRLFLICGIVASQIRLAGETFRLLQHGLSGLHLNQLISVVVLTILAGLCHELGHASALSYVGEAPGRVGVGLYLGWPVLFTDVSRVFRVDRGKRLTVDVGGVYFHLVALACLVGINCLWHTVAVSVACFAIEVSIAKALNPITKTDGYWVLVDFLRVADPFATAMHAIRSKLHRREKSCFTRIEQLAISAVVCTTVAASVLGLLFAHSIVATTIPDLIAISSLLLGDIGMLTAARVWSLVWDCGVVLVGVSWLFSALRSTRFLAACLREGV